MLIEDYLTLIDALLESEMDAEGFERRYLEAFKHETRPMTADVFQALDGLFAAVDAYCGDDELRDEDDLDVAGLWTAARKARDILLASRGRR